MARIVAVGVPAAVDGRLHANMLRSNKRMAKEGWCFIDLLVIDTINFTSNILRQRSISRNRPFGMCGVFK